MFSFRELHISIFKMSKGVKKHEYSQRAFVDAVTVQCKDVNETNVKEGNKGSIYRSYRKNAI